MYEHALSQEFLITCATYSVRAYLKLSEAVPNGIMVRKLPDRNL